MTSVGGSTEHPRYRGADPSLSRGASNLAWLWLESGLTQNALARRAGVGKRTIERYEQGQVKSPPIRKLLVLGFGLEDVIEDDWRPHGRN